MSPQGPLTTPTARPPVRRGGSQEPLPARSERMRVTTSPAAVLIRALEPVEGEALMRRRRSRSNGRNGRAAASFQPWELCRGPGNLTRALAISLKQNRRDLTLSALRIEDWDLAAPPVTWSRRIGINVGVESEWRVHATGHPAVSGPRST